MSTENMERRVLTNDEAELRLHDTDDGPMLEGYAAVFNSRSRDLGGFQEVFMKGAFEEALEGSDIRSLFNHDPNSVLGRESNGTLRLAVDERGLHYRVQLPETTTADEVRQLVARRDVTGSSLSFNVADDGDRFESRGDGMVRFVEKVERVGDVGPVTYPAYQATEVSARALDQATETVEETRQQRPTFDGTEDTVPDWVSDGTWGRPNLRDHPEVGEDEEFPDLSAEDQDAIRGRFIEQDGDTYADLSNPVVNPATDNLNRNGVLAARQRPASEAAKSIADELWDEHFEDEEDSERAFDRDRERELVEEPDLV